MNVKCYACGNELDFEAGYKISRSEECPGCLARLHCCRMCKFYDPSYYNGCKELNAERQLEKEKTNFCSYFVLIDPSAIDKKVTKNDLLSSADALFKKR